MRLEQGDGGPTQPRAPLRRQCAHPGLDTADVLGRATHLRRRYRPRAQVHDGAAGAGGAAMNHRKGRDSMPSGVDVDLYDGRPRLGSGLAGLVVGTALVLVATGSVASVVR